MGLQVFTSCCKNCLLSEDSIVSPARRRDIIKECTQKQSYFVCHKASIDDKEIICKKFFDELGHVSQMIRIAERLNVVEFVEQEDSEKLISYREQKKRNTQTT